MKPDSAYSATTELQVFHASHHGTSVRLACDAVSSGVFSIFDGDQQVTVRLEGAALVCLAEVMRRWYEDRTREHEKESR
jgi:hypothetical protein